jgi:16S rRNA G1207 methylase RsmC
MTTQLTFNGQLYQLDRYPAGQKNRSLQAWDAADILLIEQALAFLALKPESKILLINDQFGAISTILSDYMPSHQLYVVQDSWVGHAAIQQNIAANEKQRPQLLTSTDDWPDVDLVLLKLPHNHSYLHYVLTQCRAFLPLNTPLIASAKAKDIHRNLVNIISREYGEAQASLTIKKCRYISAALQPSAEQSECEPFIWSLPDSSLQVVNYPNVFAREQLDIGARFLLQHLPDLEASTEPPKRVIDLGCGNGVLGLAMLAQDPQVQVIFSDDSALAIASAAASVKANNAAWLDRSLFVQDDCLSQQADQSADFVLCNPPFHQQKAVTDHIAWQMFTDARRVLVKGGRLRIVANRHLGYSEKLARLFGGCIHIASNAKFTILEAIKRK